ncbi:MAG: hypothetical protein SFX18_01720 [Pirellulales bacterium]|nr:hypothetical protein [Pirellulales bacterium]
MSSETHLGRNRLIHQLHKSCAPTVITVTGGGSLAISDLLSVPGSAKMLLAAHVPYSATALGRYLLATPGQFCSVRTARQMGMAAWREALSLAREELLLQDSPPRPVSPFLPVIGLAATAGLISSRVKHGAHRMHVAWQTWEETGSWSLELRKGERDREQEERVVADLLLAGLARAAGVATAYAPTLLEGEHIVAKLTTGLPAWRDVIGGRLRACASHGLERVTSEQTLSGARLVFPGSFEPRHTGHTAMAVYAAQRLDLPVEWEISLVNVEKPPLDYTTIAERAAQFTKSECLWLTAAPTFVEKSRLFTGATFIVGADTVERIGQPRYYGGSTAEMLASLAEIAAAGCRFLVFGRRNPRDNKFESVSQLQLPPELLALCIEVPEADFRMDVSSTDLRLDSELIPPNPETASPASP